MIKQATIVTLLLALAACGSETEPEADNVAAPVDLPQPSGPPIVQQVQPDAAAGPSTRLGLGWESVASGEGATLRLNNPDGSLRMSIACLADPGRLVVAVPSFTPIGSEDRFAFAVGNEPVTLVADPTRQRPGAGVTGEGPIPDDLASLLAGANEIGALYGTQRVGPHIPPPAELAGGFAEACADLSR